ncbi:MAG: deoxyribose-phosphate aldolase [Elusimicrobiales bacterium]
MTKERLASYIDHTLLKADASFSDIERLCEEAKRYSFFSVCVNLFFVPYAKKMLHSTNVKICSVVGFPLGCVPSISKYLETREAIASGADEIDMVMNISAFKSGFYDVVFEDIKMVRKACEGKILKVIIETAYLTDEEKRKAAEICEKAGADFVKTSTGFAHQGARVDDVKLLRASLSDRVKIKAAGGIRGFADCLAMIEAGADRIGTSCGVAIMEGFQG